MGVNGASRYLVRGRIHRMCREMWTTGVSKHQFDSGRPVPPHTQVNNQPIHWNLITLGSFHCTAFATYSVFTKSIALMANREEAWVPTVWGSVTSLGPSAKGCSTSNLWEARGCVQAAIGLRFIMLGHFIERFCWFLSSYPSSVSNRKLNQSVPHSS